MRRSRLFGALAGLPVLFALWYLPSLGQLYWWREQTSYGASGDWASGDPAEALRALNPPDWSVHTLVALLCYALVLGAALAVSRRLPALGVVAGLPLAAVGAYAQIRREDIDDLARLVPLPGGPEAASRQLPQGTEWYLGQGLCLLVGGVLLAAALWGLRTPRRSRGPLAGAAAGLAVLVAACGCAFDARVWVTDGVLDTVLRVGLTAAAAVLFGWVAGSRGLSPAAPLACGLPALVLGVDHLFSDEAFSGRLLQKLVRFALPSDLSGEYYYQVLELRSAIFSGGALLVTLGGALAVAAAGRLLGPSGGAPRPHGGTAGSESPAGRRDGSGAPGAAKVK